jgi:hypothetical protein
LNPKCAFGVVTFGFRFRGAERVGRAQESEADREWVSANRTHRNLGVLGERGA